MRFRAAIPAAEILRHCRPFLATAPPLGGAADIPDFPSNFASGTLSLGAIDSPDVSGKDSLTFLGSEAPLRIRQQVVAGLILAERGVIVPEGLPVVRIQSIHATMAALVQVLAEHFLRPQPFAIANISDGGKADGNRIERGAVVEGQLEGDVYVGPGAYVGRGSFIGKGTRIEANATVQDHCHIGRNCVIQSGAVIGCAGFGFFPGERGLVAMPHLAGVILGEDCWIGANGVIAAGVLNPTTLGRGCKLDSHVQIAHNVRLGDDCLLASQSGIAGSTVVGHRFQMGGAASVDGHLRIGDDVSVAACSGVTKDLADKSVMAGFPAQPIGTWRRQQIHLRRLDSRRDS